ASGAAFLFRAEGMAAAAGRYGVRVVHREPGSHQAVHIIDLGTLDKAEALIIDHHADTLVINQNIVVGWVIQSHPILKARATAARYIDAEGERIIIFFSQDVAYHLRRLGG